MRHSTLNLSPTPAPFQAEAEATGVSFAALLTADIIRFRIGRWRTDEDMIKVVAFRKQALTWSPLTIASVLLRLLG